MRSCRARRPASSAWRRPAARPGFSRLIGFDMGGTSTDVSHFAGAVRARLRDRSRRRAHARADDADPHGGGRRRLDPAFRRRAVSRRPGFRRRQSRPEMLSPRRSAGGDRRQCDGRQADPGFFPEDFRPAAKPAARRRRGARSLRGDWRRRSATAAAANRSPTASSRSPSRTWRTRSRRFPCSAATT